jgi:hypothetical protein
MKMWLIWGRPGGDTFRATPAMKQMGHNVSLRRITPFLNLNRLKLRMGAFLWVQENQKQFLRH